MSHIATNIRNLIGNTPLLRLEHLTNDLDVELLAKIEWLNPSGSDKDRVVQAMLDAAEADGRLTPDTVIIEPTSGNIAFSLAMLAVPRGYRVILVTPDGIPSWRVHLLRAMGAEVVQSPAAYGMVGARSRAELLAGTFESVFRPSQFANPANPIAHYKTADEIWESCEGRVEVVVASVATGGTITGIGRRLKELSKGKVRIVAVESSASPILSGGSASYHQIFGMGPPFIPDNYDPTVIDEVIGISDNECHDMLLALYRLEGLMSGPAGGATIAAALKLASRAKSAGQRIVAIVPDRMDRYSGLRFWENFKVLVPEIIRE